MSTSTATIRGLYVKNRSEQERLARRLAALCPPGTRVSWTTWNRGHKHQQFGKVVAHGCWWSDPFRCQVRNDATGKMSRQTLGSPEVEVLR